MAIDLCACMYPGCLLGGFGLLGESKGVEGGKGEDIQLAVFTKVLSGCLLTIVPLNSPSYQSNEAVLYGPFLPRFVPDFCLNFRGPLCHMKGKATSSNQKKIAPLRFQYQPSLKSLIWFYFHLRSQQPRLRAFASLGSAVPVWSRNGLVSSSSYRRPVRTLQPHPLIASRGV